MPRDIRELLDDEVASPDAALHRGPQFVVLEAAASASAGGADLQGVSSHVVFLARGKTGPFRVETEVVGGADGLVGVRALLFDEGEGDRAVTSASYQSREVPS